MKIYNLRKIKNVIYKMKLKQYIFCAYFLFLIFPMDIRGQEPEILTPNNYIIIKFRDDMDPIEYENGFCIDSIPSRKGVNYIIQEEYTYEFNESLIIKPNDTIEIHFYNNIKSLDNFFNGDEDIYCRYIIYVDLSHFDSSLVMNTERMFQSCDRLEEINFTNFDTSSVINMGYMFSKCHAFKSLDLSHFDTSKVTNMEGMFNECFELVSLDISHFDTSKVENMGYMFNSCTRLKSLDLSHFDTSKVTNMDHMFIFSYELESLDLSHFNISSTLSLATMFMYCEKLKSLDLSNFQSKTVNTTIDMFNGCEDLVYLDISNFNFDLLESTENMFHGLSSIKYINIYNITNNKMITEIQSSQELNKDDITVCQKNQIITNSHATYFCDNSTNYIIIKYNESMNYSLFNENCPERNEIGYINNQNSILKVKDTILIEENKPIKIYFHNPIESLENFFNSDIDSNSKKIIYIDFTHFDSSLIKNTKNMINGCDSLEYLDISYFDFSNVDSENIKYIFSGLNNIKYINLSNVSNSDILKKEIQKIQI